VDGRRNVCDSAILKTWEKGKGTCLTKFLVSLVSTNGSCDLKLPTPVEKKRFAYLVGRQAVVKKITHGTIGNMLQQALAQKYEPASVVVRLKQSGKCMIGTAMIFL
jgi:hypothetical protein